MKKPVVARRMRAFLLTDLREQRRADCQFPRSAGDRPRCGRCFRCEMGEGEAALLRLSRH